MTTYANFDERSRYESSFQPGRIALYPLVLSSQSKIVSDGSRIFGVSEISEMQEITDEYGRNLSIGDICILFDQSFVPIAMYAWHPGVQDWREIAVGSGDGGGGGTGPALGYTPEDIAHKNVANGYVGLDAGAKIPVIYIPESVKEIRIVTDIVARNAIASPYEGLRVHVIDATADVSVVSGWAEYLYVGSIWTKVSDRDSIDIVLDWTNVTNKPATFTPAAHVHSATDITQDATHRYFTDTERTKLTNIAANANNYVHPSGDGNLHVPANGTTNNGKFLKASATAGVYAWTSLIGADITSALGFTPENVANKNLANGYAGVGSDGKILLSLIPDGIGGGGGISDWADITNKPSSTVANIDDAVTKRHTHSNKAILDATTESFTTSLKNAIGTIRDFTTSKLDLVTESTGTLPKSRYQLQTATDTLIADAAGKFAAANVEDALLEVMNGIGNVGTKTVDEAGLGDGKVLSYNSSTGKIEYVTAAAGGGGSTVTVPTPGSGSINIDGSDISVYAHPSGDGNLHVPANGTTNNGRFLKAGATSGTFAWAALAFADITGTKPTTLAGYGITDGLLNTDTNVVKKNAAAVMAAQLTAQNNTAYTTAQVRNVMLSTAAPSGGGNGDIWIQYV